MIHDELLIQVPKRNAALVVEAIGDAFKRAAAEKFTKIAMEFDSHVSDCWTK
jgi:DNA polymerase I-like protein with 3'-5' exonuclease and polymerase domains